MTHTCFPPNCAIVFASSCDHHRHGCPIQALLGWESTNLKRCPIIEPMASFEKLNLKDQQEILVLNAPESFIPELAASAKSPSIAVLRPPASFTLPSHSSPARKMSMNWRPKSSSAPRAMPSCGLPIPRAPQRSTNATLTATTVGMPWNRWDGTPCAP